MFEAAEFAHEHIVITCESLEDFRTIEDMMNEDGALDKVEATAGGQTIATITGMQMAGAQTVANTDGSVTGHIYTRGGTYELDGEYAQAGRILLGEE
jgi:hypothetical protein